MNTVNISNLSIEATDPNLLEEASKKWKKYGCFVVRGLNKRYVDSIARQVEKTVIQSIMLEKAGMLDTIPEGWVTPDGTLFIPAAWDGTKYAKNRNSVVIEDVAAAEHDKDTSNLLSTMTENLIPSSLHVDGTLRDKQIMVLGLDYNTSSALLRCAMDDKTLDVVSAIFRAEAKSTPKISDKSTKSTSDGGEVTTF